MKTNKSTETAPRNRIGRATAILKSTRSHEGYEETNIVKIARGRWGLGGTKSVVGGVQRPAGTGNIVAGPKRQAPLTDGGVSRREVGG